MRVALPDGTFGLEVRGTGPALVFLHGFPHHRGLWRHQLSALAARARCVAPDLRGFGESLVAGPWTMDRFADDVLALLDHLEIERAVLAGLSMGGYVAMAAWRRFPERIAGLALLDTRMGADDEAARGRRDALAARVAAEGLAPLLDAMLPGMVGKRTRRERPGVVDEVAAMMRSASRDAIVGALAALRDRPDSTGTIGTITVPTLLLAGDEDVLTPPSELDRMAAALPPATTRQVEVVTGAGHVSCLERPAAVTLAIREFLDRLDPLLS